MPVLIQTYRRPAHGEWSTKVRNPESGVRSGVTKQEVQVVRLPSFTCPESRLIGRMRESFSLGRHACRYLETHLSNVDVVYANVWPLFCQALLARHCARYGIPLVLHIQDIYPESLLSKLPTAVQVIVGRPLKALDKWIARQAKVVIVISATMRQMYVTERGIPAEKVGLVPNWIDENRFASEPDRRDACAHYGIPDNLLTFLYLGNIGPVAGVDLLIDSFIAAHLPHAQLVIAGDGSAKTACVARANASGLNNIRFISDPSVDNVPRIQSIGHICLLPVKRGAAMTSIPSKLMSYLLSAKPVLATVDAESDTARCIREADCGWVGEPENPEWLVAKMRDLATITPDTLTQIGRRGREYGLNHYSKAAGVRHLAQWIFDAAKKLLSVPGTQ